MARLMAPAAARSKCGGENGERRVDHLRAANWKGLPAYRVDTKGWGRFLDHVYLPDRAAAADAAELISLFGSHAASEAAARARTSRGLGNLVHYCRWRSIERMIERLGAGAAGATIH
jgi:hypothetical protein